MLKASLAKLTTESGATEAINLLFSPPPPPLAYKLILTSCTSRESNFSFQQNKYAFSFFLINFFFLNNNKKKKRKSIFPGSSARSAATHKLHRVQSGERENERWSLSREKNGKIEEGEGWIEVKEFSLPPLSTFWCVRNRKKQSSNYKKTIFSSSLTLKKRLHSLPPLHTQTATNRPVAFSETPLLTAGNCITT